MPAHRCAQNQGSVPSLFWTHCFTCTNLLTDFQEDYKATMVFMVEVCLNSTVFTTQFEASWQTLVLNYSGNKTGQRNNFFLSGTFWNTVILNKASRRRIKVASLQTSLTFETLNYCISDASTLALDATPKSQGFKQPQAQKQKALFRATQCYTIQKTSCCQLSANCPSTDCGMIHRTWHNGTQRVRMSLHERWGVPKTVYVHYVTVMSTMATNWSRRTTSVANQGGEEHAAVFWNT